MASVKILLRKNKTLSNGAHPIVLRIIKDRKAKFIFTGKSATPAQWDSVKELPNKKHPLQKELVIFLKQKLRNAEAELMKLEGDDKHFTADNIKDTLKRPKNNKNYFVYCQQHMDNLYAQGKINTMTNYKSAHDALLKYTKGDKNLLFADITTQYLNKYELHLRNRGIADAGIYCYLAPIRSLFNKAINDEIIKEEQSPFRKSALSHLKRHPNHRAIDRQQLDKLFTYKAEEGTFLFHALNYFKFSYYCWGINMVDIVQLKWKSVQGKRLVYLRSKTQKPFNLLITAPLEEILSYYRPETYPNPENYIFPILDDKIFNTPTRKNNRKRRVMGRMNRELTKLARELEVSDKITTYMARHSFATNLRDMDVPAYKIQHMMGHFTETMTQTYLDNIKNDTLDDVSLLLVK